MPDILPVDPTKPPHMGGLPSPTAIVGDVVPEPSQPLPHTLDCSVKEFILQRMKNLDDDGEREEHERIRVVMDNILFYRGMHRLFATEDCRVAEVPDVDELQVHNWFAHLINGKAKEWESSNPRIELHGRGGDYRLGAASKLAETLDREVRDESIAADFRQREAKYGMLGKLYLRYSKIVSDPHDDSLTRYTEQVKEQRRFHIGGIYKCIPCGLEFSEEDDHEVGTPLDAPDVPPVCPECQSPDVEPLIDRTPYEEEVETGEEQERIVPRLEHCTVDPLNVKLDHRARTLKQSPSLLYDTLVRRFEAEYENPDFDLSKVGEASNLPVRLRVQLDLERSTAGVEIIGFDDRVGSQCKDDDLIRKRMFWMLPMMYAHKRARADEVVGGVEIKAGQQLGEAWKKGLCATVYGEDTLTKTNDESKNNRWCGAVFDIDPSSLYGKSAEDLQPLQMSIDDDATMATSHYDRAGAPTEIIDARAIDPDELGGFTGKRLQMKDTAPTEIKAKDAIHVAQAGQLGADFFQFFSMKPIVMREIFGVSRGMVGQEDPSNRTARGQEISAMQSSSMMIPALSLRAEEVEPETTLQNLEYVQEHWPEEHYARFEAEYGTEAIETFRNANIRRDFKVKVAPGSWVPETREQQLENQQTFVAAFLIPYGQGAIPLSIVVAAANLMNIPSSTFQPDADLKLAQSRLARLRQWAEKAVAAGALELKEMNPAFYQYGIGMVLMEDELVPRPGIENHQVHMDFLAEQWKKLYDDKQGNPVLRDLIEGLWSVHNSSMTLAGMAQTEQAVMAESPARVADHVQGEAEKDGEMNRQKQLKAAEQKGKPKPAKKK